MSDKNLTELEWKKFSRGKGFKDAAFVKALVALDKAREPDEALDALTLIGREADNLRKVGRADKDLMAYLAGLDKALDKERRMLQGEAKKAAAAGDEEEDTPTLLTVRMVPLLRQVRKGEDMQVLLALAGKEVAVLMSRRTITPARRKLMTDYLDAGMPKFFPGTCIYEENAYTFVVRTQASGLAKKIKAALLKQVALRLKVRVRGENPEDIDDDGDPAEEEAPEAAADSASASAAPEPAQPPTAPAEPAPAQADAQEQEFRARWARLEPLILAALKEKRGDPSRIRAVAEFVSGKGAAGQYKAALQGADSLEKLLDAAGAAPAAAAAEATPPATQPAAADDAQAMAAFKARLARLIAELKPALESGREGGAQERARVAEAGALGQKKSFEAAGLLLDQVQAWLDAEPATAAAQPEPAAAAAAAAAGLVALQKSRLAWDGLRKKLQSDLQSLEQALVAGVRAHNRESADQFSFEESDLARGLPRLYSVLERLDERLIDKLDDALNASGAKRQALQSDAARLIGEYRTFVETDPLLAVIDDNGFIGTSIRSEARRTLDTLAASL